MFHVRRYFCEAGKSKQLYRDHDGLIQPPENFVDLLDIRKAQTKIPRDWIFYSGYKSIVLLGPPRQGKTSEFEYQCSQAENGFLLSLRNLASPEQPESAITERIRWDEWLSSGEKGELFIDALDEGKIDQQRILNYLANWIHRLGNDTLGRLRVHLSCRHADWTRLDQDKWSQLFASVLPSASQTHVVLELLDLTRNAIEEFCLSKDVDPNRFLLSLPKEILPIVARPQTLKFILEDYSHSAVSFSKVQELYERIIEKRLQEHNELYEGIGLPQSGPKSKRNIAEHYALTCILTSREIIAPRDSISSSEVPGEMAKGHVEEFEAFKTDLFQVYDGYRFRFNEPELADYLAAKKLDRLISQQTIQTKRLVSLFFPSSQSIYPVPRLQRALIWLCALNSTFRHEILKRNPGLLVHDYVDELTDQDKVAIWRWLVNHYNDREWFNIHEWQDHIGVLACEQIVEDLREVIEKRNEYNTALRVLAVEIAGQGKLRDIMPSLSDIVSDPTEDEVLILKAGRILIDIDPTRVEKLKVWLEFPQDRDPDNQLLGHALDVLWPIHIDLETFLTSLRTRKDYGIIGKYHMFLLDLPNRMTAQERARLLSTLAEDIGERIQNRRRCTGEDNFSANLRLSTIKFFPHFLLAQIDEWKDCFDYIPLLEEWISLFDRAVKHGLLHEHEEAECIKRLIRENHELRQQLCKQHVMRRWQVSKNISEPFRLNSLKSFCPQKEDVCFWQQTIEAWESEYPMLLATAWDALMIALRNGNYEVSILDWIEDMVQRSAVIRETWDKDRQTSLKSPLAQWKLKEAQQKKKSEHALKKLTHIAHNNIPLIRCGNEDALVWIMRYCDGRTQYSHKLERSRAEAIQEVFGKEVADAYSEGLYAYWSSVKLPQFSEYYPSRTVLWSLILVLQAVDDWIKRFQGEWSQVTSSQRYAALQAGLAELDGFPYWYEDLITKEPDKTRSTWLEVLELEAAPSFDHPTLANHLARRKENVMCHSIACEYLTANNEKARVEIIKPLIQTVMISNLNSTYVDFLQTKGADFLEQGDEEKALSFLAGAWRYRQKEIWNWIETNYLESSSSRTGRFASWIAAIAQVHSHLRLEFWPAWVDDEMLLLMLPDFLKWKVSEASENNVSEVAALYHDCLRRIAESGKVTIAQGLGSLISQEEMKEHRTLLLNMLDHCKKAIPRDEWHPLGPEELWEFLGVCRTEEYSNV